MHFCAMIYNALYLDFSSYAPLCLAFANWITTSAILYMGLPITTTVDGEWLTV